MDSYQVEEKGFTFFSVVFKEENIRGSNEK
jgi:hypothetical protein